MPEREEKKVEKIKNTFGIHRVIEPTTAVPATAWKIDNSRNISADECRVALTCIHLERDNFQQLCSECDCNESRIIAKVMDLVSRRGKLENPFTGSAGLFAGTIEEMGRNYKKSSPHQTGDAIICLTTMIAHPIYIEAIHNIDYDYGHLEVSGYAILFTGSPVTVKPPHLNLKYTLSAFDEAGCLYNISRTASTGQRFLIAAKDLVSAILYAAAIRQATGGDCRITIAFDKRSCGSLPADCLLEELQHWSDSSYVLDMGNPVESAEYILQRESHYFDTTINCEDLQGSETLSVLLTRNKGTLFFCSLKNGYSNSLCIAESMGKELDIIGVLFYIEGYVQFTFQLLNSIHPELERINALFEEKASQAEGFRRSGFSNIRQKGQRVDDFIFGSPVMEALVEDALNIAAYDCNVIIQGETGVGKEKVLGLLHKNSQRRSMPCVKINCATIQENLAESDFFGYDAGAFTGARSAGKKGYFEIANGGILFLDEVGTLSLNLQSKLLRVLQDNQFYRVGGTAPIHTNVRVICANNIPLRRLVEKGGFREDLYYRLNICTITVPPLRDRQEDIGALANAFLANFIKRYGSDKELDSSALMRLTQHSWPGNVRELENLIHRIFISVKGHVITGSDVDEALNQSLYDDLIINAGLQARVSATLDFNGIIRQQEIQLIKYALNKYGSTRRAAAFLHMTQSQLMSKKKKYGI